MVEKRAPEESSIDQRKVGFAGVLLIIGGLFLLVLNFVESDILGLLVLPVLGVLFLAYSFYTREFGFAIPGCILTGLGLGILLGTRILNVQDAAVAGTILLGLAAGFVALAFITPYFHEKRAVWPLIPGGILAVIAVLLIIGGAGLEVLNFAGNFWPLIPIAIGAYLLLRYRQRTS
jgi:hypothetical protein